MNRSSFFRRRYISLITTSIFALCTIVLLDLPVQTQQQGPAAQQKADTKTRVAVTEAPAGTDVFLTLAKTVGQDIPAGRLVEYQRRSDPSVNRRYWAIVDFNQPSTNKRFYVFDTELKRVDAYYVAHGKGSEGAGDDGIAEVFSNDAGSNSSSLGIYRSLDEYTGDHGRSMRLEGVEPTNSNALDRAVVLHTADYVSPDFIRQTGRLGRSEGCFAVERLVGDLLIDKLKNGALIIAWKK